MRFSRVAGLILILMLMMQAAVFAHGSEQSEHSEADIHAKVGELAYVEGKFEQLGNAPVAVTFKAVRLEDGANILSMQSSSEDGAYKFGMQFFDGAEHEVTVEAVDAASGTVIAEQKFFVDVQAFNPPAAVKFKTFAFLLAVIAAGMAAGVGVSKLGKRTRYAKGDVLNVK
ncbi:hypothetical protein KP806_21615 [Paenibacillus sp. N4]|uniref:hypothetical protein n=1 Tax=Paenibacillus vietnamensis TaxID=2590547 RepID=UPI001CD06496|nr:hypothetical protein [Paenibacillus vietnamensis]MCA0757665.1 hypothetical protein [Paenibacillus vietnamensis]